MKFRNNTKINHCNYQLLAKIILEGISLVQPKQFINKMMQVFQTLKKKNPLHDESFSHLLGNFLK